MAACNSEVNVLRFTIHGREGSTLPVKELHHLSAISTGTSPDVVGAAHRASSVYSLLLFLAEAGVAVNQQTRVGGEPPVAEGQRVTLGPPYDCVEPTDMETCRALRVALECEYVNAQVYTRLQRVGQRQ